MKKDLLFVFAFVAVFFAIVVPRLAFAHFPSTDKNITVIFHVEPDDDPNPGNPATLFFDIQDLQKKFQYSNCDCTVTITRGGKKIFQKKLDVLKNAKPSIFGASLSFTFPYRDIYYVKLSGKPSSSDNFQSFNVSWDFRVDNQPVQTSSMGFSQLELILSGFLGLVAIVFIAFESYLWFKKKHKKS
jgi:hypothetical protein